MPSVKINVSSGEKAPTTEQKAAFVKGASKLLVDVLGENSAATIGIIEEIEMDGETPAPKA